MPVVMQSCIPQNCFRWLATTYSDLSLFTYLMMLYYPKQERVALIETVTCADFLTQMVLLCLIPSCVIHLKYRHLLQSVAQQ